MAKTKAKVGVIGGSGLEASVEKLPGILCALAGAVCVGLGTVLTKHFPLAMPPLSLAAWQVGLGCVPIAIAGLVRLRPEGMINPNIVSGEIEASRVPSYLLIKNSEGLSVMTAWAAGKFAGDDVGMFVKKSGIADKVKSQEIIIPGYAASIAGDMEEELPGWKITVGPREAAHLPAFLKSR